MTQDNATTNALLKDFETWLNKLDRSAHSIRAYLSDVRQFAAWFAQHTKETLPQFEHSSSASYPSRGG